MASDVLNSWKEISTFLGRSVRTLQRWERFGLPVHRASGQSRSSVYAVPAELRAWLRNGVKNDEMRAFTIELITTRTQQIAEGVERLQKNTQRLQMRMTATVELRNRFYSRLNGGAIHSKRNGTPNGRP